MLELRNLRVWSFDIDHLDLYWDFAPTTEDVGLYDLVVQRSGSPAGPFHTVATLTDQAHFRDVNVNREHTWRAYYYRIQLTQRRSGDTATTDIFYLQARPILEGLEMSRLFRFALQTHLGRQCLIFKRRTSGQRCVCFDDRLGRRTTGKCEACFGTGYSGGYWAPILTYVQIDPTPKSTQLQGTGETQQQNTGARVDSYPPMDPRDVIVEAENVRWRVAQVTTTERARSVVRQEMQLHRIPESDVEYLLPVKWTTPETATPATLFTEPTTL